MPFSKEYAGQPHMSDILVLHDVNNSVRMMSTWCSRDKCVNKCMLW